MSFYSCNQPAKPHGVDRALEAERSPRAGERESERATTPKPTPPPPPPKENTCVTVHSRQKTTREGGREGEAATCGGLHFSTEWCGNALKSSLDIMLLSRWEEKPKRAPVKTHESVGHWQLFKMGAFQILRWMFHYWCMQFHALFNLKSIQRSCGHFGLLG